MDPIPMLLWCPECGDRHIDVGEFSTKVHHTHACQSCGHCWRPAVVATIGAQFLPGFKDTRQLLQQANNLEPATTAEPERDLTPQMVKIGADRRRTTGDHVAVLLPQYNLLFDARAPLQADTWQKAVELGQAVDLLGLDGWQLPSRAELALLIDDMRANPAINTDFFPATPTNDWYWTRTVRASASSFAWYVNFYYGYVDLNLQDSSGFVRACRRVSPGQF